MIRQLIIILMFLFASPWLKAQSHSYFLGRKNMVGLDYNISGSSLAYNKGAEALPFSLTFRFDRILNKSIVAGVSLTTSNAKINDEFNNEGKTTNYFIDYKGIPRNVNNGNGNINLRSLGVCFNSRFYRKNRTTNPIGNFWGFRTGMTFNKVLIPKDYEISYTQYYGSLRKDYFIDKNQSLNFSKFHLGIEYGKTSRFLNDRLFFTYSFTCFYTPGKRFNPEASLNERFLYVAEKNFIQSQLFTINLGFNYAF